ncbi:EAL domain-containing protein [Pseudothauera nasutitermitis]|uniref:EAL domain-containing protein n=1 Tax=Pseudothauera nasutitermitis TaxID=2565930 RepID=A0A4S4B197_9RHOO|nr:EAL domain-containing protein [Pseudothauera nasutitermitis]THF66321.1 EAL domain-containing protein [Pseudothauera nasutitermitis]
MKDRIVLLAFRLDDPARLRALFGDAAMEQALAGLGEGLDTLTDRVLNRHARLERRRDDARGCWSGCFQLASEDFPRDPDEIREAVEVAARRLAHELLLQLFGAGSGRQIAFRLVVLPWDEGAHTAWGARAQAMLAARLEDAAASSGGEPAAEEVAEILAGRTLRTVLQPIVRMADRRVVGFEALTRGPAGSPLERPDRLFDAAHAAGQALEMELLCAELALERTRGRLPAGQFVSVNLGPEALARAVDALPLHGRNDVVIELTEHLPLDQAGALAGAVERLRAAGALLALDDTGCGFADLDSARALAPEIVKLCITVIRHAGSSARQVEEIRATTAQLHALGCRVLAEGVETEAQHAALAGCGMELAQGWLYGRPCPVDEALGGLRSAPAR